MWHNPSGGAIEVQRWWCWTCDDDQALHLEKKKGKNKRLKAKLISIGAFWFGDRDT